MKISLAAFSILMLFCNSLQSQNKSNHNSKKMKQESAAKAKISYILHVNSQTPYELYFDDILVDFHYGSNISNTTQLNPYLLGNGKHTIKIKLLPQEDAPGQMLSPKDIIFDETARWHLYFTKIVSDKNAPLGYSNEIDYAKSELKIQAPAQKVPFWEQTWDVEINDLPYQVKGWSESQDLRKIDKDKLEKEVVDYFSGIRDLLN